MNAKTLERIVHFRFDMGKDVIKEIMYRKISYQFSLIGKKARLAFYRERLSKVEAVEDIFIVEALAAREYWSYFKTLVSKKCDWKSRSPRAYDPVNKLFDIGYHHLTQVIAKTFEDIGLPYELGLLHKAQSKSSKPLVYDFMEWLRPIVVDRSVLVFLRKKKRKFEKITPRDIGLFINMIKNRFAQPHYHKKLGYCVSLEYWMRLNALSLLSAINHHCKPSWKFPSLRHESRCKNKKPQTTSVQDSKIN